MPPDLPAISDRVGDLLVRPPVPAMAVGVFRADRVVAQSVTGVADLTTGRSAEIEDWWDLASLTKVLVTLPEALALVDDGRLDLDRPIGEVWPRSADHPVAAATTRQLLSHDAGLPATVQFFLVTSGARQIVESALATPPERPIGSAPCTATWAISWSAS